MTFVPVYNSRLQEQQALMKALYQSRVLAKIKVPKLPYLVRLSDRDRARNLMTRAIEKGWLLRRPCEVCGNAHSQGHHIEYSQPYNVRWLCKFHHRIADALRTWDVPYSRSGIIEYQIARRNGLPIVARIQAAS